MTNLQPPTTASLDDRMFTKCKALEGTSAHSTVGFSTEDDYTIPSEQAEELVRKTEFRVSELLNQTTYLKRNHRLQNLPLFERSDFEIGDVVGLGGFSTICDISSFHNQHQLPVKGGRKYVVKSLTPRLAHETKKLTTGARDLVMEAYYVSALAHKNIIELRGCSAAGVSGFAETCRPDGFFLVYDKLTITLGQRINQWREESSKAPKSKGLLSIPKPACIGSPEMLVERLNAAIDVASALEYMHDKRILFRDLKPGNVGYDGEGTLKIFDFGLAVELPARKNPDATFYLGGNTGTPRYMAVEVIRREPYNLKADVFSFSILLWEVVAMLKPYNGLPGTQVKEMVSLEGARPIIPWSWPFALRKLLKRGWSQNLHERPDLMKIKTTLEKIRDDVSPGKKFRMPTFRDSSQSFCFETNLT